MNSDFKELLQSFNEAGAKYLVVGGYAVMEYSEPRYTKDLDIWVGTDAENAPLVYQALAKFGAPIADFSEADFREPEVFFQIGVAPVRVDILTSIIGVDFTEAWCRRDVRTFAGIPASYISIEDLITAKIASGRRQDKADVTALRKSLKQAQKQLEKNSW